MSGQLPRFCPHCAGPLDVPRLLEWGGWVYDEELGVLLGGGLSMLLTSHEAAMMGALIRAEGRLVSKDGGLYSVICRDKLEIDWPDVKSVDVYISKLRSKFQSIYGTKRFVATLWGKGYYLLPYNQPVSLPPRGSL